MTKWISRHPKRSLLLVVAVAAAALPLSLRLGLTTDLVDLLPADLPAVESLRAFDEQVGGHTYLSVVVESPDPSANLRFGAALSRKLEAHPWAYLVQFRRETAFYRSRWPFVLGVRDLEEIRREMADAVNRAKVRQSPLSIDLSDERAPAWDEARRPLTRSLEHLREYSTNESGTVLLIQVQLQELTSRVAKDREILADAARDIEMLRPAAFHPALKAHLVGGLQFRLLEYQAIVADVIRGSLVTFPVMLLIPAALFRSARAPLVILVPVALGMVVTYACAELLFGNLNLVTAFLFFVIYGIGDDYPIHLFVRVREQQTAGLNQESAVASALRLARTPLAFCVLTDVAGFGALGLMRFQGFSQFGVISAIGVTLVLVASYLCVPGLIRLLGLGAPGSAGAAHPPEVRAVGLAEGSGTRVARVRLAVWVALVAGSGLASASLLRFENDFLNLRPRFAELEAVDEEARRIPGYRRSTPAVFFTTDYHTSRDLTRQVQERIDGAGADAPIRRVLSVAAFVDGDTPEKRKILGDLITLVNDPVVRHAPPQVRADIQECFGTLNLSPMTLDGIPPAIRRGLTRPAASLEAGREGYLVVVEPTARLTLADNATAFARQLEGITARGQTVVPAGEGLILAEVLQLVRREAPVVLVLALVSVMLLLTAAFRSARRALLLTFVLAGSLLMTTGLLAVLGMRLHFFNVLVLPVVAGLGVDYGIHVLHRAREDRVPATRAARRVAGPVLIGAATTAAGFMGLLVARHPGLWSMGFTAIAGIVLTAVNCLLFLPALADAMLERHRH